MTIQLLNRRELQHFPEQRHFVFVVVDCDRISERGHVQKCKDFVTTLEALTTAGELVNRGAQSQGLPARVLPRLPCRPDLQESINESDSRGVGIWITLGSMPGAPQSLVKEGSVGLKAVQQVVLEDKILSVDSHVLSKTNLL